MILDADLYKKLNFTMLGDSSIYRRIAHDPTNIFLEKLRCLLQEGVVMGAITFKQVDELSVDPITPFYH